MTSNSLVEKVATDLIVALAQHFDRSGCPAMAVTHASEEGVSLSLHFSMDRAKALAAMEGGWRDRLQEMARRVEHASNMFHNSQDWHSEDAPDGNGTMWEWVFAPARALSPPPPEIEP